MAPEINHRIKLLLTASNLALIGVGVTTILCAADLLYKIFFNN